MKVDKRDLNGAVVEVKNAATITKSDSNVLATTIEGVVDKIRDRMPACETGKVGEAVRTSTGGKQREPVEDCEAEEEGEHSKETSSQDVDCLTTALQDCSIHNSAQVGIEAQLERLAVRDEEDETRCSSLQSQSSVIAVEPPSLSQEEEEERGEAPEDLAPRGPTDGKPAAYRPHNDAYNKVSRKAYTSHNLDKFHRQADLQPSTLPQTAFPASSYYNFPPQPAHLPLPIYTGMVPAAPAVSGKRGMEEDEDNPFKYTRPFEDIPFNVAPTPDFNDLSGSMKKPPAFMQISQKLGCGAQVLDNSPEILSPTELTRPFKFQPQISMTDVDTMLEMLNAQPTTAAAPKQLPSHTSPSQGPHTSPPRHPDNDFTQTCQPVEKVSNSHGAVRDYDPGYSSENSPHSETLGSPSGSPKSSDSPMRPPSNMSQDSGIASPFSDDNMSTVVPSPPSDYSQNRSWAPGVEDLNCGPYGMVDTVAHSALYPSPHSVASSDDMSLMSAPSPYTGTDSSNNYDDFFNQHKNELKDALDVVADEMKKAKVSHGKVSNALPTTTFNAATPTTNSKSSSSTNLAHNIPLSVSNASVALPVQQKSGRPEKLPIAPLPRAGRESQPASAMVKGPVPVMLMPNSLNSQPATTAMPVVTSSQPFILMPQGQASPVIVVVNNPQPVAQQLPVKKQPVPILPRPGPPISSTAPAPPAPGPRAEAATPKLESGSPPHPSPSPSAPAHNGGRPSPGLPQPPAQHNAQPRPHRPQQSRMLNLARRLVASMTTTDLTFKDVEGDTYLHVTVCKADRNMGQALLERLSRENLEIMINAQNSMRQTPLYLAVSSNTPEMVELLIQYGAEVNVFAEHTLADGRTVEVKAAVHCAASNGEHYLHTLQALLTARELNIDLVNSDGHTALHCAILEHGKPGSEGGTVNSLPIIQELIRHGADPNAQEKKSGKTALMYALESRDIVLMENMVALIDPARLRTYLKTQAFDGSTCQRIMDKMQLGLDSASKQRLIACLKV